MKGWIQIALVIVILAVGGGGAWLLVQTREEPQQSEPVVIAPLVRSRVAVAEDVRFRVTAQGTVGPRTESALVSEVAGRVVEVSPSFVPGGFFRRGEVLLRIEPYDYEQAIVRAEAEVARARLRVAQEEAEAALAIQEWNDLSGGEAPPLTRREPQLEEARAAASAAEAALSMARRNLERTTLRAPFDGRVRSEQVDLGQYVGPGNRLATLYATDSAEIRLPIPDKEMAYLDLPQVYGGEAAGRPGPSVRVMAEFGGQRHEWQGRIVRTEGEIDPRSRLVHVVAEVRGPYRRGDDPGRPPLTVGMYVTAEIEGRLARNVVVLPRASVRGDGRVLIVDDDDRLRFRTIEVIRATDREVMVQPEGIVGERVCLSSLAAVTDGMQVRTEEGSTSADPAGSAGSTESPS